MRLKFMVRIKIRVTKSRWVEELDKFMIQAGSRSFGTG